MRTVRHLRWWIVALLSAGTVINYLARNTLGVLAPVLKHALHLTTADYSYVVGAFQLAYTLMEPVCGAVVDRIGLQLGFSLFAVAWSLANMLHALAAGWVGLALFRFLLGMSEAAAIPSGMKAIAEWFPARERSVATGWFNRPTLSTICFLSIDIASACRTRTSTSGFGCPLGNLGRQLSS